MKKISVSLFAIAAFCCSSTVTFAQFGKLKVNTKTVSAAEKGVASVAYSDADAARDAKEAVDWMDKHNKVAGPSDPYTTRLNKIFGKA